MLDKLFGRSDSSTTVTPENSRSTSLIEGLENIPPREIGEARKKLRWLCQNPPEDLTRLMRITPAMAAAMLEWNENDTPDDVWRNRPHSPKGVKRYARAMKRGWKLTGETIIFGKSGRLLNGQNRLRACVDADTSFPCLVVCGIDNDAFSFMDTGMKRTAGHVFAIDGVPNAVAVAAASRLLYGYLDNREWNGAAPEIDNEPLLEFYYSHEKLQDGVGIGQRLNRSRLMACSWGIFLHYICSRKSPGQARDFFTKLSTGVGFETPKEITYKLYDKLTDNAKSSGAKLSDVLVGAYTVQAWNSLRSGNKKELFRWRTAQTPTESFPRAQ